MTLSSFSRFSLWDSRSERNGTRLALCEEGLRAQHSGQVRTSALMWVGRLCMFSCVLLFFFPGEQAWGQVQARQVIDLDGSWQIAQGTMDAMPQAFDHTITVPGLIDLAQPAFEDIGHASKLREAFWYRRTFQVPGAIPAVATLKVSKAWFGTCVYVNGKKVGEHIPLFTPGYFNLKPYLKGNNQENDIVIRVGASPEAIPISYPRGGDYELSKHIPGIYDDVQLILSGTPNLVRVQAAPDIANNQVHVQALVHDDGPDATTQVNFIVREAKSGTVAGTFTERNVQLTAGADKMVDVLVPIKKTQLWSPENPFLYSLEVSTSADVVQTRFGMREFHFNPADGHAYLNGRIYYMRGSNITLYRFFEDADRGVLPWDKDWVRRLNQGFKGLRWNSLRYSICYPPDFWYDIADEEGILLQDEFPIWALESQVTADELAHEYAEHMQDHWNHPSVVIWDAQNETSDTPQTGQAIEKVRQLDISNRPWDNGWGGGTQVATDSFEAHPYHFLFKRNDLRALNTPPNRATYYLSLEPRMPIHQAIILNEYGGLWLQRNGQPTDATRPFYDNLLGASATPDQYRKTYAHYMAADTEYWRGYRDCAGVMEFTALGYTRSSGVTSDNFEDVKTLKYEPHLYAALKNSFSPVGVMMDYWEDNLTPGQSRIIPVVVINDLYEPWRGTVDLRFSNGDSVLSDQKQQLTVPPLGRETVKFTITAPAQFGTYDLQAALVKPGDEPVVSDRAVPVAQKEIPIQQATASSELAENGTRHIAKNAVDDSGARWSSEFSDPQWLAVDLGKPQAVDRVELHWETAFGAGYRIEVSIDGKNWTSVYQTDQGRGGNETVKFTSVNARWVRFYGTRRGTQYGYSLFGIHVF